MTDDQQRRIAELLVRVFRMHRSALHQRMASEGSHIGQPFILFELDKNDSMSQRDLSRALNLSPATITITLARMEKAGLVRREIDAGDKRVQNVMLTEKGSALKAKTRDAAERMICELFAGISEEDIATLTRIMESVYHNLAAICGSDPASEAAPPI